jgi:hypothetical protein
MVICNIYVSKSIDFKTYETEMHSVACVPCFGY